MDPQMSSDVRCAGYGLLVGTNVWLPSDPTEHYVVESELIGCNRLFCSACRSWVRHLDDVRFTTDGEPPAADLERLYADPRADRYRGFRRGWLGFRVYLCRCSCVEIAGIKETGWLDNADGWSCAGHPRRETSAAIDPSQPSTEAEVERMLRSSASGPPRFGDDEPWDFALRWRPPFLFSRVWPVVTRLLLDPDPIIRARAVELVNAWRVGDATTLDRLTDVATKHASLYQEPTLQAKLATTLASKSVSITSYRPTIAKAVVTLLGGAPPPKGAESLVAEYEPEAVIRSAGRWTEDEADQNAAKTAAGSIALYRRDHLIAFLTKLAGRTVPAREEIVEEVGRMLAVPDDKLRLILDLDSIPMPQAHPTVSDCRRALGLTSP